MRRRWVVLTILLVGVVSVGGTILITNVLFTGSSASAIVTGRSSVLVGDSSVSGFNSDDPPRTFCVSYDIPGTDGQVCEQVSTSAPPECYQNAQIGQPLPDSCPLD